MVKKKTNNNNSSIIGSDDTFTEGRSDLETNKIIAELRAQIRRYEVELMNNNKKSRNMEN